MNQKEIFKALSQHDLCRAHYSGLRSQKQLKKLCLEARKLELKQRHFDYLRRKSYKEDIEPTKKRRIYAHRNNLQIDQTC